jgi:uncharacterized protein YdcH (DUF465 family)
MEIEHHRDLAHEFPELKHRIHELKQASAEFRHLYEEYQAVDNEIHRIEQEIETPSDEYTEELKRRRVHLKDRLYWMLTGRVQAAADTGEYVIRHKFRLPVDQGEVVRDWIERGYSCRASTELPGEELRDLRHDGNGLITVVDGRLAVNMHGLSYVLDPGDEMFIPRDTPHTVRNLHDAATLWIYGND